MKKHQVLLYKYVNKYLSYTSSDFIHSITKVLDGEVWLLSELMESAGKDVFFIPQDGIWKFISRYRYNINIKSIEEV